MSPPSPVAWRVFPWMEKAEEGEPFSASFVPAAQGWGRFDLAGEPAGVLYLAETSDHAVGEKLQDLRNQTLEAEDLAEFGHPLALVEVRVEESVLSEVADLCDPATLARLDIPPDEICALDRTTTQGIATRLFEAGYPGFRWWSAFFGEWHTLVLFRDRLGAAPVFGAPEIIAPDHPAVTQAAHLLGIRIAD